MSHSWTHQMHFSSPKGSRREAGRLTEDWQHQNQREISQKGINTKHIWASELHNYATVVLVFFPGPPGVRALYTRLTPQPRDKQ